MTEPLLSTMVAVGEAVEDVLVLSIFIATMSLLVDDPVAFTAPAVVILTGPLLESILMA